MLRERETITCISRIQNATEQNLIKQEDNAIANTKIRELLHFHCINWFHHYGFVLRVQQILEGGF